MLIVYFAPRQIKAMGMMEKSLFELCCLFSPISSLFWVSLDSTGSRGPTATLTMSWRNLLSIQNRPMKQWRQFDFFFFFFFFYKQGFPWDALVCMWPYLQKPCIRDKSKMQWTFFNPFETLSNGLLLFWNALATFDNALKFGWTSDRFHCHAIIELKKM